ncbi:hypothetical protein DICVIV_09377 [Dictyocaulus viviparus]|uniref:C2 domain-containing protein n=1 Tax=Dictyocaulus viviparus TaxID=29172 RepID=A0A0D8XIV4_DICVI|nr:hypothetical protein DICVIV_09377 [Dictyocaulus viviparus]
MRKLKSKVTKAFMKNTNVSQKSSSDAPKEKRTLRQPVMSDSDTDKKHKKSDKTTDTASAVKEDDTSDSDEHSISRANLHYGKIDRNFGTEVFVDTDKRTTWHVLLRVIEGRDLKTGALRVRAYLEGLQKCTRVTSQGNPRWKQNLVFMLKDISLQKLASETLAIKVTRAKRFSEKVTGEFGCPMGAVIHSPDRRVISKWIAMRAPVDEDDDDGVYENCGFLKVSINVYGSTDCPARMNDDLDSEEIWSGAQLEEMSLRVRLFRLHQIADEIHQEVAQYHAKSFKFIIKVTLGAESAESTGEELCAYKIGEILTGAVSFNQELLLPLVWPTVISKVWDVYLCFNISMLCTNILFRKFIRIINERRFTGMCKLKLALVYFFLLD